MPVTLTHRPALVTGADSGVARSVAPGLARAGADVSVSYASNSDAAAVVVQEIEG